MTSTQHRHRVPFHPHALLMNHPWTQWTGTSPWYSHAWHHVAHTLTYAHWRSDHAHALIYSIGSHHTLLRPPRLWGADLCWGEEPLSSLVLGSHARRHQVASHAHLLRTWHLLHALYPHPRHPLNILTRQVGLPVLLSLGERHVERLGHDDAPVHLSDCFRGFLRSGEAHKAKTLKNMVHI